MRKGITLVCNCLEDTKSAHLLNKKDIQSFWDWDLSPGYEAQQGRLALAIGPHQAIPPASCHTQLSILQQQLTLSTHRQAMHLQQKKRLMLGCSAVTLAFSRLYSRKCRHHQH